MEELLFEIGKDAPWAVAIAVVAIVFIRAWNTARKNFYPHSPEAQEPIIRLSEADRVLLQRIENHLANQVGSSARMEAVLLTIIQENANHRRMTENRPDSH